MSLYRLTDAGINAMRDFLGAARQDATILPNELLEKPGIKETVSTKLTIHNRSFATRLEMIKYLFDVLDESTRMKISRDANFFSWLSLVWFEHLCVLDKNGERDIGEDKRHIAALNGRDEYRHLIAGPFQIYSVHEGQLGLISTLMATPPHSPGEFVGQIAANMSLMINRPVLAALHHLYYSEEKNDLKRGAAQKDKGGARRFVKVLKQLGRNFDFHASSPDELLGLLPKEFDKFKLDTLS